MKINIQVEGLDELQKRFKTCSNDLAKMQKFWHNVGEYMKKRTIKECFDKEQSPDGQKWKLLSEARHNERINKGANYKILSDTGELRRSIHYRASDKDVVIGSNLKYAPIHNFGGSINVTHKMRNYLHFKGIHLKKSTMQIKIPARPFLGVTQADKNHILEMMKTYVQRSL